VVASSAHAAMAPNLIDARRLRIVQAAAVQNFLVTHEGVSNDVVYGMTKALWTNLDQLTAAHSAAKAIDIKHALAGMPIPLHPGAEKYYKEVGVLK
jgi:TRAP transporter TAXI family solute receptor